MSTYWQLREAEQRLKFQSKTEKELEKELERIYRASADKLIDKMVNLYPQLLDEDTLVTHYYRYIRYFELREQINKELISLGKKELKEVEDKLKIMYLYSSKKTLKGLDFPINNKKELETVIKALWDNRTSWSTTVWCKDGLSGTQRVEKAMTQLHNQLERGLSDCVLRGASKDELVKTLKSRFGVSYSEASRMARTELTYIQNQATLDSYKQAGIEQYEFLAELDDRTSDICHQLNKQRFNIDSADVGVNYPPMHPNCRSTVLAVIK